MTTKRFLRRELKREITLTFHVTRRFHDDVFVKVVETFADKYAIPLRGRRTAIFLLLLRRAFDDAESVQRASDWEDKEKAFVELSREQEETIVKLRAELEIETTRSQKLLSLLRSASQILHDDLQWLEKELEDTSK